MGSFVRSFGPGGKTSVGFKRSAARLRPARHCPRRRSATAAGREAVCAERVGFAVRAWTTGAEIVSTREPGAGGYAPAALGLQCLADHREPLVVPLDRGTGLEEARGDAGDPHGPKGPFGRSCCSERVRLGCGAPLCRAWTGPMMTNPVMVALSRLAIVSYVASSSGRSR